MNTESLLDLVLLPDQKSWAERAKSAFPTLFGSPDGRYPKAAEKIVSVRAPGISAETGVPFAALIHPENPTSGAYSGLSFVLFPVPEGPCLIGLVVGTNGLAPDDAILGRPGHARKAQAICSWLNHEFGKGKRVAWAKQDPTRVDIPIPAEIVKSWPSYKAAFARYGEWMYALYAPTEDRTATREALTALLDLFFDERGFEPIESRQAEYQASRAKWFEHLMPGMERDQLAGLLTDRKYAIVQGPPGTGKTRMATELLRDAYAGRGRSIQFHPNTTYENFIGGLGPVQDETSLGLRFAPAPGFLMQAAAQAASDPAHNYLLHIDEINRADLGKVLGEAIFLLEASSETPRTIELPYDFGEPFHRTLTLPPNLHLLGTMNSADRSIAIVDVAVRRRFAFVSLWPRMAVVERHGCEAIQTAFRNLVSIFVEHATDDAFSLIPGHSYFLEGDESKAKQTLVVNLVPLLEEYLAQGYVGGFAEPIRAYLQEVRSLREL